MADPLFPGSDAARTARTDPKTQIETIAKSSRIPVNYLFALTEAAGGPGDPETQTRTAQRIAEVIGPRIAAGEGIKDILRAEFGDKAEPVRARAQQIAQELYPEQWAAKQAKAKETRITDLPLAVAEGATRAVGSAARMIGAVNEMVDEGAMAVGNAILPGQPLPSDIPNMMDPTADAIQRGADYIGSGVSQGSRNAAQASMPSGNLFDPSTWAQGDDPTLQGYAMLGADLLGSMAPVVIASIFTGPGGGAIAGGLTEGGAAIENAEQQIDQWAQTVLPDGRRAIEVESAAYQRLIASGLDHNQAMAKIKNDVGKLAAAAGATVGLFGGAATGAVVKGAVGKAVGGGTLRRALASGAISAVEEGTEEVLAGIASRGAVKIGADTDQNVLEGTLPEFALGAMGGGVVGAGAGALSGPEEKEPDPDAPLQLPAPNNGGTIFADGPVTDPTLRERPPSSPPGAPGAARRMRDAAGMAPPPLLPDVPKGTPVTISAPDMEPVEGVFTSENALSVTITGMDGKPMEVPRAEIESGAVTLTPGFVEPVDTGALVTEQPPAIITEVPPVAPVAGGLAAKAAAKRPAAPKADPEPETEIPPSLGEVQARIGYLQEQGRTNGFTKPISEELARLKATADALEATALREADAAAGVVTKKDGSPFKTEAQAKQAVKNRQGDPDAFIVEPRAGGFVARPAPKTETPRSPEPARDAVAPGQGIDPPPAAEGQAGGAGSETRAKNAQVQPANIPAPLQEPAIAAQPQVQEGKITARPMAPAEDRDQPDMLGGATIGEQDMAAKERRKREWGQFLGIASHGKSDWDGEVEGRPVRIRRTRVRVLAGEKPSDQDMTLDTDGMSKEDISGWMRDTLRRMPPMPAAKPVGEVKPVTNPTPATSPQVTATSPQVTPAKAGTTGPDTGDLTADQAFAVAKEWLSQARPKTAGLAKGPGGQTVNVSFNEWWGNNRVKKPEGKVFVRARNGLDAFYFDIAKVDAAQKADSEEARKKRVAEFEVEKARADHATNNLVVDKSLPGRQPLGVKLVEIQVGRDQNGKFMETHSFNAGNQGMFAPWKGAYDTQDEAYAVAEQAIAKSARAAIRSANTPDADKASARRVLAWLGVEENPVLTSGEIKAALANPVPTAAEVAAAAAEADPDPTDAQKEAENYKKGHISWNGLDISIETAKGGTRSGTSPTGKKWSVKMPAHYGYIRRTEGADGDHVDVYIGEKPDADSIFIFDQYDPQTKRFDEHKVVLGVRKLDDAVAIYDAGFSDGSGPTRRKAPVSLTVNQFKSWLANGDLSKPANTVTMTDFMRWSAKDSGDPDEGTPGVLVIKSLQTGKETTVDTRPSQPKTGERPKIGDPDYTLQNAIDDLTDAQNAYEAEGMIKNARTGERMRKLQDLVKQMRAAQAAAKATEPAIENEPDPTRGDPDPEMPAVVTQTFTDEMRRAKARVLDARRDGRKEKIDTAEAELRRMRSTIFEAEDAALQAIAARDFDAFIPFSSDFARVGAIVKDEIRKAKSRDASAATPATPATPEAPDTSAMTEDELFDLAMQQTEPEAAPDTTGQQPDMSTMSGDAEAAWDGADDPQRERMLVRGGMTEAAARRYVGRDWSDLNKTAMTAVENGINGTPKAPAAPRAPSAPRAPRTATQSATSAVKNIAGGTGDALDGLMNFFGGKGTLNSGPAFSKESYAAAKPLFVAAVRQFGEAGQDILETVKNIINALRGRGMTNEGIQSMRPFVTEFTREVRAGFDPFADATGEAPASPDSQEPDMVDGQEDTADERDAGIEDPGLDSGSLGAGEPETAAIGGPDDGGRDGAGLGTEGDAGPAGAGDNLDGGVVGDGAGSAGDAPAERQGVNPGNFVITPDFPLGEGTPGQKIRANMAAIRLIKALKAENRHATKEEQAVLARYVGWGGLKRVFDVREKGKTTQFGATQTELRQLLTPAEYRAAAYSTAHAHYTSREVVGAMWDAMRAFGFDGGRVLEPTSGTGNFLGLQPQDLAAKTEWFATELDSLTGDIAERLYPDATILAGRGFENAPFRAGSIDVAIGNPPFGSELLKSKLHPEIPALSVHNYIIAKTGLLLRPGGIMGMVVTNRFLDTANPQARDYLAKHFRFIGAVRLPNTAFKANAGTEVTTDVVWFQKRRDGEPAGDLSWLDTDVEMDTPTGMVRLNGYFAQNPDMMIGNPSMKGTLYGGGDEFTLDPDGRDLPQAMRIAFAKLKAKLPERAEALADALVAEQVTSSLAIGESVMLPDGRLFVRRDDDARGAVVVPVDETTLWGDGALELERAALATEKARDAIASASPEETAQAVANALAALEETGAFNANGSQKPKPTRVQAAIYDLAEGLRNGVPYFGPKQQEGLAALVAAKEGKRLGPKKLAALRKMLALRRDTRALLKAENDNAPDMEDRRKKLLADYRAFVEKHGYINASTNDRLIGGIPGVEAALEHRFKPGNKEKGTKDSAQEAAILHKRVIKPLKGTVSVKSAADGIHVSLKERGRLDLGFIASLTGSNIEAVITELTSGDNPQIFRDPERGEYVIADEYLSGNLAEKIVKARATGLYENVAHLERAMPPPKEQAQIQPTIRSLWLPEQVFKDFLADMGAPGAQVRINMAAGSIEMEAGNATPVWNDFGQQFRTERRTPLEIMAAVARGKAIMVFDRDSKGNQVKNEQATQDANAAATRMAAEFEKWAYLNPERAGTIVDAFNTKMNVVVPRKFNGVRYLSMVGANPDISLRNSQKNGAWRMMLSQSTLLHHVVGAGKTFTAITAIMERKRLGLSKKTLVAVPNHIVSQWARDFYALYPGANILAATEKDFEAKNRRKLIARIATGDYDAIIIGHSALKYVQNSVEETQALMEEQLNDLNESLDAAKAAGNSGRTVSQIQSAIKKYGEKMSAALDALKADNIGFDFSQMGVDNLVIDEAHEFKNLEYSTSSDRLVGMNSPAGSARALDLYIKTRGMMKRGQAVGFLTGTPVSNSLVEIFTIMKYMAPKTLRDMNLMHYDAWSSSFVQAKTVFEYTPSQKLKERNVMRGLVNLGPLSDIYRSFADVVMRPEVEAMYREQIEAENEATGGNKSTRFPTPKVKDGGRQLITIPASPDHEEFTDYLVMRMDGIKRNAKDKEYPKKDNPLWVLSDARKASIDIRAVDPDAKRNAKSKVTVAGNEVLRIAKAWEAQKGTQLVFCDSSVPAKTAKAEIARALKVVWEKAGLKKGAEIKARMERDAALGKSFTQQWGEAMDMLEERLSSGSVTAAQQDSIEEWMNGADAADGAATAVTADTGFSFYDDMKAYLTEQGMPAEQIAFVHDYGTAEQKAGLFEAVNAGEIRVLIGSTFKMGAGTNAQERLVGLHHIDAPWRPSDMEQREGRIIRQGNKLYEADPDGFEVEIKAYATQKTSDVVLWQVLERKAAGILQFLNATADTLTEEDDSDADTYATFMAQSTGNPVFLQKMEAEKAVRDMESAQSSARMIVREATRFMETLPARTKDAEDVIAAARSVTFTERDGSTWAAYRAGMGAYEEARKAHEAETDKVRAANATLPEGVKKQKLPEFEGKAPVIFPETGLDPWMEKVKTAIERAMNLGESQWITVGAAKVRVTKTTPAAGNPDGTSTYYADLQLGGRDYNLTPMGVTMKNPLNSRALVGALMPDAIRDTAERVIRAKDRDLERMREAEPDMREKAARRIDDRELNAAKRRLEMLKGRVRLAEVTAAQSRMGKTNRFALMDRKGRDLTLDNSADKPLLPTAGVPFEFQTAGGIYTAPLGARDGSIFDEGIKSSVPAYWFDAKNDAGERALILAKDFPATKDTPARLEVEDVYPFEAAQESRMPQGPAIAVARVKAGTTIKGNTLPERQKNALIWFRDNLLSSTVTNEETGMVIRFNGVGAKKSVTAAGDDVLAMIPALPQILARGRYLGREPNRGTSPDIRAAHTFAATVSLDGKPKDVVVIARETGAGVFEYRLSRDTSLGARFSLEPTGGVANNLALTGLDGDAEAINIEVREPARNRRVSDAAPSNDGPVTEDALRAITKTLRAELANAGLAGKATVAAIKGLTNAAGIPVQGTAQRGAIRVNPDAPDGALGVMRHEVIHVLRDATLWGNDYGLFTHNEWRALVRAARGDKATVARVSALYPDLSTQAQSEEMVAELYRAWAAKRDQTGIIGDALRRIMAFLEAVANGFRGQGFQSAALTMERIARGNIGGRGPDGGGTGTNRNSLGRFVPVPAEKRDVTQTEAFKAWFGKSKVTDENGDPMVMLHSTWRDFEVFDPFAAEQWRQEKFRDGIDQVGSWFTSEKPDTGKDGNPRGRYGPKAIQAYVRIEKPLYIEDTSVDDDPSGKPQFGKDDVFTRLKNLMQAEAGGSARAFRQKLRAEGYDGIILTGWLDGYRGHFAIALDSAQVKSTDNRGTFDPASDNIRELRMPDVPFATTKDEMDAKERNVVSQLLTDAMGGASRRYNLLALVPGRALFQELGKGLPSARRYLRLKEQMDTMRSEWHGRTDEVAQAWREILSKDPASNRKLMDLMHDATQAGVDPSLPWKAPERRKGTLLEDHAANVAKLKAAYADLRPRFAALPEPFQKMFATVRDTYDDMATAFEDAVIANARKAMAIGLERAERQHRDDLQQIADDGLTGDAKAEATEAANRKLAAAKRSHGWNQNARLSQLRQQFESNRLDGPYFPLQRFGNYFVTVRDENGKVVSFSRFESEKKQAAFAAEQRRDKAMSVTVGVLEGNEGLKDQVDPNFVADIEQILGEEIKDPAIMDMVWQRWLETLPDFSVRKSRIHRKGTPGYDGDAFRAFGRQVFHGSHQLARLTYALDMQKALEDARREAAETSDPNRAAIVVNEMEQRHAFTMNPTGSAVAQTISSAAFIYYLGITPAAAIVNLAQTTVVGIPMLASAFRKGGVARASKAVTLASRDFLGGRFDAQKSKNLTAEEREAMVSAYDRGVIDKSEAHDLAGVAESGVEYSSLRMRIMKPISFLFHHTERANREITFLAAYRMAREDGLGHEDSIQKAGDLTWKAHFDYQNTSRPRMMQNDAAKVLFIFRNFSVNMIWRLFRDLHQTFKGKSEAERREARGQLIGITMMMMAHAGITGTWGYSLITLILGMFVPGGSDEIEEEIKAGIVNTFGPGAGGFLLKGVPGHLTGIDLTNRIGMPELWFRSSDRELEGDDEYHYFLEQMVGAAPGIVQNVWRGTQMVMEGEILRGVETALPKALRDLMKAGRYASEGVTTYNGDVIFDPVGVGDAFVTAMGFSPARISERYEANTRLKNAEKRITRERQSILSDVTGALRAGEQIGASLMDDIDAFNEANPDYPITQATILRSLKSRIRASEDMQGGITLNNKLERRLREEAAPTVYQ